MDAGGGFSPSSLSSRRSKTATRCPRGPLQEVGMRYVTHSLQSIHTRPTPSRKRQNCDRFIPDRSSMDMDVAHYLLTESCKKKKIAESEALSSPSKEAYRKRLAETMLQNRTRILSFKSKPPTAPENNPFLSQASNLHNQSAKPAKQRRYIPQSADRVLDAPDLVDDYYLNLLDWGSANVLAIALGNTVYLWDAASGSTSELATIDEDAGPITSICWAADGRHIALGLNNSDVQLWDSDSARLLRTLRGAHSSRVGAMSWNSHLLTTGGMDGLVVNNDVRVRDHMVHTYRGHTLEVCGLKWSPSGQYLASGGNDNLVHIWDVAMSSSSAFSNERHHRQNPQNPWLHRLSDHVAAVKSLAWCPFQSNLLASGGGGADRRIKFWNTHTGSCLNSVDTGSQVCALLWSKANRELLSAHGFTQNQLTLWKYPSMTRMAELTGHTSRVLFMAQSPDGCIVASAAGDETLRFWNAFGAPEKPNSTAKSVKDSRITGFNHIR